MPVLSEVPSPMDVTGSIPFVRLVAVSRSAHRALGQSPKLLMQSLKCPKWAFRNSWMQAAGGWWGRSVEMEIELLKRDI